MPAAPADRGPDVRAARLSHGVRAVYSRVDTCATWSRAFVIPASSTSRATMDDSATFGHPESPSRVETPIVIESPAEPPTPTVPTRLVVSRGTQQAHPMGGAPLPRAVPGIRLTGSSPQRARAQIRPASALALQRRIAGVIGIGVIIILILAVALIPRGFGGAVLSATGKPGSRKRSPAVGW